MTTTQRKGWKELANIQDKSYSIIEDWDQKKKIIIITIIIFENWPNIPEYQQKARWPK